MRIHSSAGNRRRIGNDSAIGQFTYRSGDDQGFRASNREATKIPCRQIPTTAAWRSAYQTKPGRKHIRYHHIYRRGRSLVLDRNGVREHLAGCHRFRRGCFLYGEVGKRIDRAHRPVSIVIRIRILCLSTDGCHIQNLAALGRIGAYRAPNEERKGTTSNQITIHIGVCPRGPSAAVRRHFWIQNGSRYGV